MFSTRNGSGMLCKVDCILLFQPTVHKECHLCNYLSKHTVRLAYFKKTSRVKCGCAYKQVGLPWQRLPEDIELLLIGCKDIIRLLLAFFVAYYSKNLSLCTAEVCHDSMR